MRHALLVLITVALSLVGRAQEADRLTLVTSRAERWTIVVPDRATPAENEAAGLLARYAHNITGIRLEILPEACAPASERILIGNTTAGLARAHELRIDQASLGPDGFAIRAVSDELVILAGLPDGSPAEALGVVYAVSHLLETHCGVRFWAPGAIHVPSSPTLTLPADLAVDQSPEVWFRQVNYGPANDPDYRRWHKLDRVQEEVGHLWAPRWVHSFFAHVSPDEHFDAHPEYFSLVGDRRTPSQLCLTNDEVFELVVQSFERTFEAHPGVEYISFSQEDNYDACACGPCAAIDAREGTQMGSLLTFVNRLAERFPDRVISTLAYQYSRKPPAQLEPRSNVSIMLCTIEEDRARPIAGSATSSFPADLAGWTALTNDIFLWDYEVQFASPVAPFPNLRTLGPNVRWFADAGVRHLFLQGNGLRTELAELRCYLLAKLAWDPDTDVEATTAEFLAGYYGPAAEHLDAYLDLLHDELEAVPRRERAPRVRAELLAHAATTQAELTAWLERNGEERGVTDDEILWAANARTITMPRGPLPELLTGPAYRGSFWASDSAARLEPRAPASARPPAPTRPARPAGLAAAPSPLPLSESFESGSLPTGWTTIQIPGLTSVRIESQATYPSAGTPHDQAHHLVLDSPGAPFDLPGELWVPVAGVLGQGLAVDFAYQVFDAGPGVEFYFGDGTDEWLVTTLPPTSGYATFSIDLGEDALFHDVDLGPNTFLRWRWEGAGPAPGDGFTLDQLEVATTPLGLPFAPLPHLVTLQADQLHQRGVDGTGVLVLAIDNGADAYHKDLVAGRWENPGEVFLTTGVDDDGNGYVDDYIGWNFASDNNKPHNPPHPHGTGTAGLVIGDGTTNHLPTGVAPGAKLAYATVAGIAGHPQSKIAQLSQAYAYAITIGADLTTASIGASELLPLERELLRATMDSVHAAGILSVAAAGNTGLDPVLQVPEKIGSPADCPGPWRHPDQPVVGGLGPVLAAGAFDLGLAAVAPSSPSPSWPGFFAPPPAAASSSPRPTT